jgi:hypothetical protein
MQSAVLDAGGTDWATLMRYMGVKTGTGRAQEERKPIARVPRIGGGCFLATRYGADACIRDHRAGSTGPARLYS